MQHFRWLDEIWNVVETIGNEDTVLGRRVLSVNYGTYKSGKTGFGCREQTEYLPSAIGPFPLLRCFGRAGCALLVTQLGKGVGQLRV